MGKSTAKLLIVIAIAAIASSCISNKTYVGNVSTKQPMVKVNSVWNHHLLWGLVPVCNVKMRAAEYVGNGSDFMVRTDISFVNGLVTFFTAGLYAPTTTTYFLPAKAAPAKMSDWDKSYSSQPQQDLYQQNIPQPQLERQYQPQPQQERRNQPQPQQERRNQPQNYPPQQNMAPAGNVRNQQPQPNTYQQPNQNMYQRPNQTFRSQPSQPQMQDNRADVILLRDGSTLKGNIVEKVPGQTVSIRLSDGNVYTYRQSDIIQITKD